MLTSWLSEPGDWLGRLVFTRGLALVYLVAFVCARNQFRGLLGTHGLTPIPRYLVHTSWRTRPSVFRLHYSDRFFAVCCWVGVVFGVAGLVGAFDLLPWWAWLAAWLVPWALYLSIVSVGQQWYGFGWESLLLEAGFLAVFCGPASVTPPVLVMFALRWLLFRLEFGAGLIKMRGDACWRSLTCLNYHHETQPMPGPLSSRFHHLPVGLHKAETLANHITQLVVVFGLFAPQPVAGVCALIIAVTQAYLIVSGNFSWLNLLALLLALSAVDGRWLTVALRAEPSVDMSSSAPFTVVTVVVAVVVAALSVRPVVNLLSPRQVMNTSYDPLHLVNSYGAFGSVTRRRYEVILEATDAAVPGPDTVWREYRFRGKPGDVHRRPRQIAPYHLRLDWLLWFVAISPSYGGAWFGRLLEHLRDNDPDVVRLLRTTPFPDGPAHVRARLFHYTFTSAADRRATGRWWDRRFVRQLDSR